MGEVIFGYAATFPELAGTVCVPAAQARNTSVLRRGGRELKYMQPRHVTMWPRSPDDNRAR